MPSASARRHLVIALLVGAVAAAVVAVLGKAEYAPLAGWDTAGVVYLVLVWRLIWPMDGDATARWATREDPTRRASESIVLLAALASLVAVGVLLLAGHSSSGVSAEIAVAVGSVAVSWVVVHTVFTLGYARLYYADDAGGVDFNSDDEPDYGDFAYLSFTVGMTFQVSDTNLTSGTFRRAALRQAWVSYVFGAVILASVINLVAGLSH